MYVTCVLSKEDIAEFAQKNSDVAVSYNIRVKKSDVPTIARPKSEKTITLDGVLYEFNGFMTYNAVKFLLEQEEFKSDPETFFKAILPDEPLPDIREALYEDVTQRIKSINQTLKKKKFPYRVRKVGNVVFLRKLIVSNCDSKSALKYL